MVDFIETLKITLSHFFRFDLSPSRKTLEKSLTEGEIEIHDFPTLTCQSAFPCLIWRFMYLEFGSFLKLRCYKTRNKDAEVPCYRVVWVNLSMF